MLAAADRLLRTVGAEQGAVVSMDAIADAAGVGKGTLFRAFGDRDGLLEALAAARFATLRHAAEDGTGVFGSQRPAAERVVGFLDAVLDYKIENAALMRAREAAGSMNIRSERYRWTHEYLQRTLTEAVAGISADEGAYLAHTLLSPLQLTVLDDLVERGHTVDSVRRAQSDLATTVLACFATRGPAS